MAVVVAESGRPPVHVSERPDGSFAVLDGEVCNLSELQTDGADLRNPADAALGVYLSGGDEALERIDGAWTAVFHDGPRNRTVVARDRWGAAPVFYAEASDGVLWSSDVGSLLRAGVPGDVNLAALDFFFGNGFVPSPWTFARDVRKMPPAHLLRLGNGTPELRRYYRPTGKPKLKMGDAEVGERFLDLLERALRKRASGRIAVLLSSGVDSKLMTAGLRKRLDIPLTAYTFRYANYDGVFNEGDNAREAARQLGAEHREIEFRPQDLSENIERLVQSYGEPFTYGLHTAMLGPIAEDGVEALLTGVGPDGWYLDRRNVLGLRLSLLPRPLGQLGDASVAFLRRLEASRRPQRLWNLYAAAGRKADRLEDVMWCARTGLPVGLSSVILPEKWRAQFYRDKGWVADARRSARELFDAARFDYPGESRRDTITFVHRHFRNPEGSLYWNHCWGRAHGLVMRFPYFDRDLMEFVLRLPRKSGQKGEMRRAAARFLSQDLSSTRKIHQEVPVGHWLRRQLLDWMRERLSPERLERGGIFDPKAVQLCIEQHLGKKFNHGWKLWCILTAVEWQELAARKEL